MIAYTIESALRSRWITKLAVSTDDQEIATVARQFGADVPFVRPPHLATDSALAIDVVKHALEFQERLDGIQYSAVALLQPTTPLKAAEDIDATIDELMRSGCDSVVTMVDVGANHPARMYRIVDGRLVSVMDERVAMKPRQDLEPIYIRNGAVYACRREVLFRYNALIGQDVRPLVMPPERSVNIDESSDIILAEHYLRLTGRC